MNKLLILFFAAASCFAQWPAIPPVVSNSGGPITLADLPFQLRQAGIPDPLAIIPSWHCADGTALADNEAPTDCTGNGFNPVLSGTIPANGPAGYPSAGQIFNGTDSKLTLPSGLTAQATAFCTMWDISSTFGQGTGVAGDPADPLIGSGVTSGPTTGLHVFGSYTSLLPGSSGQSGEYFAFTNSTTLGQNKNVFPVNANSGAHMVCVDPFGGSDDDVYIDGLGITTQVPNFNNPGNGGNTPAGADTSTGIPIKPVSPVGPLVIGASPSYGLFATGTHYVTIFWPVSIASGYTMYGGLGLGQPYMAIYRIMHDLLYSYGAVGDHLAFPPAEPGPVIEATFEGFYELNPTITIYGDALTGGDATNTIPWTAASSFTTPVNAAEPFAPNIRPITYPYNSAYVPYLYREIPYPTTLPYSNNPVGSRNVAILSMVGYGDLNTGTTAPYVAKSILSFAAQLKAFSAARQPFQAPLQVIIVGFPSLSDTAPAPSGGGCGGVTCDTQITAVNKILQAEWAGNADAFVNPQYSTGFATGGYANPSALCAGPANCYQSGGYTLTNAGASTMGGIVAQAVNYLQAPRSGSTVVSGTLSMTGAEGDIMATGTFTLTAPPWLGFPNQGRKINNIGSGTVTIAAPGGYTINGTTSLGSNDSCYLFGDGTTKLYCEANPILLTGSGSITLSPTTVPDGTCGTGTFTITGAVTGDRVVAGWPSTLNNGFSGIMKVTSANTVTVSACNFSGGSLTPGALTYAGEVIR